MFAAVVASAAGCSPSRADRAPAGRGYDGASDPYPATAPIAEDRGAPPSPAAGRPARRQAAADPRAAPPTVAGILLDPTFTTACQLHAPPRAFFAFDSADLDSRDAEVLRRVAACLTRGQLRGHRVQLVGHADPRGSDEYNRRLARARVESVRDFLRDEGVPASSMLIRISGEGFGDPLWPGGWDFDRRVDIRLLRP